MNPKIDKAWQRAVVRLLDGQMSEAERTEWEKRLLRHPEAHALLRDYQRQDEHLAEALDEALGRETPSPRQALAARIVRGEGEDGDAPSAQPPARLGRWISWLAAAAAVLLVAGAAWLTWGPRDELGPGSHPRPYPPVVEAEGPARAGGAADVRVPIPPAIPPTQIRRIDRYHVDVFDEETREVRRWSIDREQIEPHVMYVGL